MRVMVVGGGGREHAIIKKQGFVEESKKVISEDNRVRIYYRLTEEGYAHLDKLKDLYADLISTVQSIIYEED